MASNRRSDPPSPEGRASGASSSHSSAIEKNSTTKVMNWSSDHIPVGSEIDLSNPMSLEASAADAMWLMDPRANHPRLAPSAENAFVRVFGWRSEILKTGRWGFVSVVHPDDRDRVLYELSMERPYGSQMEFRVIDAAGEERHLRLSWKWLEDQTWVEFHAWDLTDHWLAQRFHGQELREQKLTRAIRARLHAGEFAGLLKAWPLADAEAQQSAPWSEILMWLQDVWGRRLESQRVDWRLRVDVDELPGLEVAGSRGMILLMLSELLRNAAEALPAPGGRESRWISMDVTCLDDSLIIGIEDSGSGVGLAHRGSLFLPFFTTKDPAQHLGLGLFLVRNLVEAVQGGVRFDHFSAQSRFALQLPLRRR
ncbi:MAG TPA: ATP-binding protein [Pseudobdellovibrionaceae bacterium]|nr:ATP-binding protein [Pseudobdellovibrionaceae bacterium]